MYDNIFIDTGLLPEAFLNRMEYFLTEEEYKAFLSSYGQKRRYSLRINPLKTDKGKALSLLQQASASVFAGEDVTGKETKADRRKYDCRQMEKLEPVPWESDGFYYPEDFRPGRLPWHEAGMYYIQEASAMVPAMLCNVKPGDRVLDICAAPGGKSAKLAACLQGEGILVANEIHPERAKILSSNLERMGVRNALVTNESPQRLSSFFPLFFDHIVVDAPCSGEGMFRKEEEALAHWSPENVWMCAERQLEILKEAASMLRPGGRLVYSTCTFSPEENEGVIFRFLMEAPDFSVDNISDMPGVKAKEWGFSSGRPEWLAKAGIDTGTLKAEGHNIAEQLRGTVRLWPHLLQGEGHFAAVLRKSGPQSLVGDGSEGKEEAEHSPGSWIQACNVRKENGRQKKEKRKRKAQRGGKSQHGELPLRETQYMWEDFCKDNLISQDVPASVSKISGNVLCMFGNTLFALPKPAKSLSLDGLHVLRAGLQLGSVNRKRFEPSHALAMALDRNEVHRYVEFEGDSPQAYAWIRGESVSVGEEMGQGWTLVSIDGCSAGWGKVSGGVLKNHYPKGLRKGSNYKQIRI